jgi:hypothetical protein
MSGLLAENRPGDRDYFPGSGFRHSSSAARADGLARGGIATAGRAAPGRVVVDRAVSVVDFRPGSSPDEKRRALRLEEDRAQVGLTRMSSARFPERPVGPTWRTSTAAAGRSREQPIGSSGATVDRRRRRPPLVWARLLEELGRLPQRPAYYRKLLAGRPGGSAPADRFLDSFVDPSTPSVWAGEPLDPSARSHSVQSAGAARPPRPGRVLQADHFFPRAQALRRSRASLGRSDRLDLEDRVLGRQASAGPGTAQRCRSSGRSTPRSSGGWSTPLAPPQRPGRGRPIDTDRLILAGFFAAA